MQNIRVYIMKNSVIQRKVLQEMLEEYPHISIVGSSGTLMETIRDIQQKKIDLLLYCGEDTPSENYHAIKKLVGYEQQNLLLITDKDTKRLLLENRILLKRIVHVVEIKFPIKVKHLQDMRKVIIEKINEIYPQRGKSNIEKQPSQPSIQDKKKAHAIIAIGSSTGGPRALQRILTRFPRDLPAAILIVQHMPSAFTKTLAERLDALSSIHVKEATDGEEISEGVAYIAPGSFHMKIDKQKQGLTVHLSEHPKNLLYRPSVDILFQSVARLRDVDIIAVVLTGMGKDGTKGIQAIRQKHKDAKIISEAKESAIVYGMPKSAEESGVVDEVIPLDRIAERIMKFLKRS